MAASSSDSAARLAIHADNDPERSGVVTDAVHCRRLTTIPGNTLLCGLPVGAHENEVKGLLNCHAHPGVSAPPVSGKSANVAVCVRLPFITM